MRKSCARCGYSGSTADTFEPDGLCTDCRKEGWTPMTPTPEEPTRDPEDIRRIAELEAKLDTDVEAAYLEGYADGRAGALHEPNLPANGWHDSAARALLGENDGK